MRWLLSTALAALAVEGDLGFLRPGAGAATEVAKAAKLGDDVGTMPSGLRGQRTKAIPKFLRKNAATGPWHLRQGWAGHMRLQFSQCQNVFQRGNIFDAVGCKRRPGAAISGTLRTIIDNVDGVYVLMPPKTHFTGSGCNRLGDHPWMHDGNTVHVFGDDFDHCFGLTAWAQLGHPEKASLMHWAAIEHARKSKARRVLFLEGDTVFYPIEWDQPSLLQFRADMLAPDPPWDVIRLSYRYTNTAGEISNPQDGPCLPQCKCQQENKHWCLTSGSGCTYWSAAAYILHEQAFDSLQQGICCGGLPDLAIDAVCPVDKCPFARLRSIMVTPALATQKDKKQLFVDDNHYFVNQCRTTQLPRLPRESLDGHCVHSWRF